MPGTSDIKIRERLEIGRGVRALEAIFKAVKYAKESGYKLTIATCGPMTNLALFVSVYPDLLSSVERVVMMGGGVGMGNRSSTSGAPEATFSQLKC